ncbi:MAG: transposase family protein [Bryobacteraceae bacterium]
MGVGCVWRSPGSAHGLGARAKKTVCGVCGQEHRTFYDRKTRLVRDLSCGDTRVYLEVGRAFRAERRAGSSEKSALPSRHREVSGDFLAGSNS